MKWFKHESDSHSNIKLQAVIDKLGISAYGYYWACVELVANQGENFRLKRDKRWEMHLKKMLNITPEEQKKYLIVLAKQNLIDKESLKRGELYIPKLKERCDEYTTKLRRKSGQSPDNVPLEEKRRDKKRREYNFISYLKKIPEKDLLEFYKRFDCSKKAIISKAEDLILWCETNGKQKKNYRTFLLNALKKDFLERKIPSTVRHEDGKKQPEGKPIPKDIKASIKKIVSNKTIKK